jgi:hypothetical protein
MNPICFGKMGRFSPSLLYGEGLFMLEILTAPIFRKDLFRRGRRCSGKDE